MLRRILRVLFGFVLACLAAGATTVAFADIQELRQLTADDAQILLSTTGERILFAAFQGAVFAAPIAALGIMIGEWRRIQSWTYYTLLALAITFLGFLAWSSGEAAGDPTIINNYAMTAFMATGFVGGLIYWLFSGRNAGRPYARSSYDFVKTSADAVRTRGPAASSSRAAEPEQQAKATAKDPVLADVPAKDRVAVKYQSAARQQEEPKNLDPEKVRPPAKKSPSLQQQLRDQMASPKPASPKPASPIPVPSKPALAEPTPKLSDTTAGAAAARAAKAAKTATESAAKKVAAALDPRPKPSSTKSATSVPETAPNTKKS